MYNGKIIRALMNTQGKSVKELNQALGLNPHYGLKSIIEGNPTASRLEQIADFFGVPIDTFFTREIQTKTVEFTSNSKYIDELLELKSKIIADKEEEIKEMKLLVELLKEMNEAQK